MKECMKDLDETIEAILGPSKAEVIEEFPQGQDYGVHVAGCIGNERGATMESWKEENEAKNSMSNERYVQVDGCHTVTRNGHAEGSGVMKGLHFASTSRKVEDKLFELPFGSGVYGSFVDDSGIMGMKPFGSSEVRHEGSYGCSRTSLSDLEEILGLATGPDKSMGGCSRTRPGAPQDSLAKLQPANTAGYKPAPRFDAGNFRSGHTDARWLRDIAGTGRSEINDLWDGDKHHGMTNKPAFDVQEHFGHRRAGGSHFLHEQNGEECIMPERTMNERPMRQQCTPLACETQYHHPRTDSRLFRNPIGSLDQLKSQVYYRIKKRRRLNSSTWNLGDSLSMVHPSRLSSLEFVSGCSMGGSPHVPGCASLPLILNASGEMMPEGMGVAHRFKKMAESMDFSNITVFQLKQLMRDYGLSHAGKKNDLIDRIKSTLREINNRLNVDGVENEAESPKKDEVYDNFFF